MIDNRSKASSAPVRRPAPGLVFRAQIEQALAAGRSPEELLLKLTLADSSLLKLDRTLAVADISFADGQMRFLGVPVQQGGVAASELTQSAETPAG